MKIIDIIREDEGGKPQLNKSLEAKMRLEVIKLEKYLDGLRTIGKPYTDDYGNDFVFKDIESNVSGNNSTVWTEISVAYDFHSNEVPKTLIAEPLKVFINFLKESDSIDFSILRDYRIQIWLKNYRYNGIEVLSHNNFVYHNELNQLNKKDRTVSFDINYSDSQIDQMLSECLLDRDIKFQVVDANLAASKAKKLFNTLSTGTVRAIKGDENDTYLMEYKLLDPKYYFELVHHLSEDIVQTRVVTHINCDIEYNQHANVRPATLVKNIIKLFKQFRITLRTNNSVNNPNLKYKQLD